MKTFICAFFALAVLCCYNASGQTSTVETKTSTDSTTGKTTTTYSTTVSRSEDITVRKNMIVINPLKFFLFYNLSYYRALSNTIVVGGGVQMPTPSGIGGFGVNGEVRFHPSGKALRGFYIAPNVSFNSISSESTFYNSNTGTETTETVTGSAFSVGGLLGWQWFPGDEFAMGLGIGADYYFLSGNENGRDISFFNSLDGMAPAFRFDIGYAW